MVIARGSGAERGAIGMKRNLLWVLFFGIWPVIQAQHPFYLNMFEEARRFMAAENWEMADRYLEIAAFGLLKEPELLSGIYVHLVIVQDHLQDEDKRFQYISRAKKLLGPSPERPSVIPISTWNKYQRITAGQNHQESPPPPKMERPEGPRKPAAELEKHEASPTRERLNGELSEGTLAPDTLEPEDVSLPQVTHPPPQTPAEGAPQARAEEKTPADQNRPDPIDRMERAVRAHPSDSELKFKLADMYIENRALKKAKKLIRELARTQADNTRYSEAFVHYNFVKGDHKKNIRFFGDRDDLSSETAYYVGLSYVEMGDYTQAARLLSRLSRDEHPQLREIDERIRENLAESSARVAGSSAALRMVELEKKFRNGQAKLSEMLELIGQHMENESWQAAKRVARKAYDNFPNQDSYYYMGRVYLQERNYKHASLIFYNLANSGYREGEVFFYGGKAALFNGDASLARYMFNRAEIEGTGFLDEIRELIGKSTE